MLPNPQSRPPSPRSCPICYEPITPEVVARLEPCGHEFDLECVTILLRGFTPNRKLCPFCRTTVEEVRYSFQPSGTYETHRPGTTSQEEYSGAFLREDERLRPEMTEQERTRTLDLRRLRNTDDYNPAMWQLVWLGTWAKEGDRFGIVGRTLSLKVLQKVDEGKIVTKCLLSRCLAVGSAPEKMDLAGPPQPEEVARARAEVKEVLDSIGISRNFTVLETDDLPRTVHCDERGINATSRKSLEILNREGQIMINEAVTLNESFPNRPEEYGTLQQEEEDLAINKKAVNFARQEIQGALEVLRQYGEFHDFKPLEPTCTGIMELVLGGDMECEYCKVKHRNGDCRLPWSAKE